MNENQLQSPHHSTARMILRVGGPLVALVGLILMIVGVGSFFASFGSFEPPRYFWCAFAGMPLLVVGLVMCKFGYLGTVFRYFAGETAPVAKDTFNYVAEGMQPGVRALGKSITEGIVEGQKGHEPGTKSQTGPAQAPPSGD
jgi:hypothetical protein